MRYPQWNWFVRGALNHELRAFLRRAAVEGVHPPFGERARGDPSHFLSLSLPLLPSRERGTGGEALAVGSGTEPGNTGVSLRHRFQV